MKPYYQDSYVTIYHGDCREWFSSVPACFRVDVLLTDPPYGLEFAYLSYVDTQKNLQGLIRDTFPAFRKVASRACISPGITNYHEWPRADWVCAAIWDTTGSYGKCGVSQWFPILFYGQDLSGFGSVNGQIKSDVFRVTGGGSVGFQRDGNESSHTCPKPLGLWKKILNRFSLVTETVIDPFVGSGTTLVAAKERNQKAIGIEIEEAYCEIAARRCEQEVLPFSPNGSKTYEQETLGMEGEAPRQLH